MICEDPVLESIILYYIHYCCLWQLHTEFFSRQCFYSPSALLCLHDIMFLFGRLLIFSNPNRGHHIIKPLTKEGSQQNSADWMSNLPFSRSLTLQLFIDLHVFTCQDLKSISWIHFRIIGVKKHVSFKLDASTSKEPRCETWLSQAYCGCCHYAALYTTLGKSEWLVIIIESETWWREVVPYHDFQKWYCYRKGLV